MTVGRRTGVGQDTERRRTCPSDIEEDIEETHEASRRTGVGQDVERKLVQEMSRRTSKKIYETSRMAPGGVPKKEDV